MQRFLTNEAVLAECKIYQMLKKNSDARHLSFHTPGHKMGAWDITELSFSDNLSCPRGCIAEAERDIADVLGANSSFILTDGSTSGVLSILHAAKGLGVKSVAFCESSHKSVFHGCALLGLTPLIYPCAERNKIPYTHTMYELNALYGEIFEQADALLFTSPDYYGNIADLAAAREYCNQTGKWLLVDGAHGGHLHFDKTLYAGAYADLWVDGVHKSLPAFTQGAVVSARTAVTAEALRQSVDIFRTTSPSYPIMASVEYAVKYPRNAGLEKRALALQTHERVYKNDDWTKLCAVFGNRVFEVEKRLEAEGCYIEFCDGNTVNFYLSPATADEEFTWLENRLLQLFKEFPLEGENIIQRDPAPLVLTKKDTEWVDLERAQGRICAGLCGLFPPCTPLFKIGETMDKEKLERLQSASNVFGLKDGKILTFKEEE